MVEADEVVVSTVSIWELAIKLSIGKLRVDLEALQAGMADDGMSSLPLMIRHSLRYVTLPLHHRDPFDRMLIAQALEEDLTMVTSDGRMAAYGLPMIAT